MNPNDLHCSFYFFTTSVTLFEMYCAENREIHLLRELTFEYIKGSVQLNQRNFLLYGGPNHQLI